MINRRQLLGGFDKVENRFHRQVEDGCPAVHGGALCLAEKITRTFVMLLRLFHHVFAMLAGQGACLLRLHGGGHRAKRLRLRGKTRHDDT